MATIKNNSVKNIYGTFIFFFCQWLSTVLVFRISGAANAGIYALALSYVNIFEPVANFSLRSYILSENKFSQKDFFSAQIISLGLALLCSAIFVPFAGFNGNVLTCCLLLMLFKMACAFTDFLYAQMQLSENYTAIAISSTLRGIIPLIFLCIGLIFNLQIAFLLFLFAYLVCCFVYDIRVIKIPFKFDFSNVKTIFLNCFPLVLSAFVSPIMNFATRFVIEKKYSEEVLGCFSSISILSIIMPLLASAVWLIFLPHFSNDFRDKNFSNLKKYSFWVFLISIPFIISVIILCYFFGEPILVFVLGENIKNYVYLAVPVVMISGVTMLCGYFSVILLALQKRKLIFIISLAGMVCCFLAVYPFVLKFGLIGAVWALLFAGITQFVIYITSVLRLIK